MWDARKVSETKILSDCYYLGLLLVFDCVDVPGRYPTEQESDFVQRVSDNVYEH